VHNGGYLRAAFVGVVLIDSCVLLRADKSRQIRADPLGPWLADVKLSADQAH